VTNQENENHTAKEIPDIRSEEDAPFPESDDMPGAHKCIDTELSERDDLETEITRLKYQIGRKVLYIAMAAMAVFVVADLIAKRYFNIESELITNAFEAFKLITMTVLGYIFGSSNSK